MVSSYSNDTAYSALANIHVRNPLLKSAIGTTESLTNQAIQGRTKSKWNQGFLGGCGSSSQFQGCNQAIPVMPSRSNNDIVDRIESSSGLRTGTPLEPSWVRTYAFAPGRGIDARLSNITHTDKEAGRDTISAVVAPLVNPGIDRFDSGPAPPIQTYQGLDAMTTAPAVTTGGEAASNTQGYIKAQKKIGEKKVASIARKRG